MLYHISIIGGSGSGKSTLASILSRKLNLPVIHLDSINFNSNWEEVDKSKRDEIILNETKKDKWIIEGNYLNTIDERFNRADLIIFLDYSTFSLLKGVLKRFFVLHNKQRAEIPGCKEKISVSFLQYVISFNKLKRPKILEKLNKFSNDKILILKNRKDLNTWLKNHVI